MDQLPVFTASLFLFAGFTAVFSAGPPGDTLHYVETGSKTFTLPPPAGYKTLPGDFLIWKRNGTAVHRSGAPRNAYTVSRSGALELPAEALEAAGQVDVYTLEVYDQAGRQKLNATTSLHLPAGSTTDRYRYMCMQRKH